MLTSEQIEQFKADGFLVLKRFFAQNELASWNQRFLDFANELRETTEGMKLMKDVMIAKGAVDPSTPVHAINKLLNFEDDEVLMGYVRHSGLVAAAQDLIGPNLYSIVTNVFNKPPDVDGRHPLHQDLRYFRIRPPEGIVACWTAISPTTRDNGCLAVVPGSHKKGLRHHGTPEWEYVNFKFYGIDDPIEDERHHVEMDPGDTILFHPLLIHGSGRNRTDDFRRSISAHYASDNCVSPPPDWRENEFVRRIT